MRPVNNNSLDDIASEFCRMDRHISNYSFLFTKLDILRLIVLIGTFALAMAFAGNDLVNFIGVPLAGYNSYELYVSSGQAADSYLMEGLAGKVQTPTIFPFRSPALIMTSNPVDVKESAVCGEDFSRSWKTV